MSPGFLNKFFGKFRGSETSSPRSLVGEYEIDFRALAENSLDMICVVQIKDHTPQFVYVSPSAPSVIGWPVEELLHVPLQTFFTEEAMDTIKKDVNRLLSGEESSMVVIEAIAKDGRAVWLENKVRVLDAKNAGEMSVMVCMRDVTARKALEDQLAQMAMVDGLTGIANRRAFDQGIDQEWRRSSRVGLPLSLILMDVDHFKSFNDTYGHQLGDDCLRAIAQALQSTLNRAGDFVARYGGEEFAILLPGTEMDKAELVAIRLCSAVAAMGIPHAGNTAAKVVTISCGLATGLPLAGATTRMPDALVHSADLALYKAKDQGRNRVVTSFVLTSSDLKN